MINKNTFFFVQIIFLCDIILFIRFVNQNRTMSESMIKNDKQAFFNQIKGEIKELNSGEKFCNITLEVGHDNKRFVNLTCKTPYFEEKVLPYFEIGDRVCVLFFIVSRNKHDKWYTSANILEMDKDNNPD